MTMMTTINGLSKAGGKASLVYPHDAKAESKEIGKTKFQTTLSPINSVQ